MLEVRTPADPDWDAARRSLATANWWLHPYAADDPVGSVRAQLDAARDRAKADPDAARRDWEAAASGGPRALTERAIVLNLEQITAMRARLWDPRLDLVADAASTMRAFWHDMAPNVPLQPAPIAAPLPASPTTLVAPSPGTAAGSEAELKLDAAGPRGAAVRILWHRVAAVCTEVARHAEACAARTKDPVRRAGYAELAQRCGATAAALQPVLDLQAL